MNKTIAHTLVDSDPIATAGAEPGLRARWRQSLTTHLRHGMQAVVPADLFACGPLKSADTAGLGQLWTYFRRRPLRAALLVRLLRHRYDDPHAVTGAELPDVLLLLEVLLVLRRYAECGAYVETLATHYPADLRVQDVRARAQILAEDDAPLAANPAYGYKPFADRFCSSTFDTLAFFEDGVYICCCNYLPSSIGSIAASSQDALWNSDIAQNVRGAILDGSFSYCNKMVCPRLRNRDLPLRTEPTLSDYYKNIIQNNVTSSPGCHPRSVELNEDPSCNLVCPSCRAGPVHRDNKFLRDFEANVMPGVLENPLGSFLVACYGEPFASSHYLRILHSIDPARHRIGELVLYTNGVLFTRQKWEELSNLHGYAIEVRISIDAATAPTYAQLRPSIGREGNFGALQKNLEFVGTLRRDGRIAKFKLFFVVQGDNFREMPDFVRMGQRLHADEVVFSEMQKYGVFFGDDARYASKAVHLAGHPDHAQFRAILADPVLRDPMVSLHGCRLN